MSCLLQSTQRPGQVDFECNRISEDQLCASFFSDGRRVDKQALQDMLRSSYRYLDGMEALLARLSAAGYEIHAMSNYPAWWRIIEDKLALSRYLRWTFLSCCGPMENVRKPSPAAYQRALDHLGCGTDPGAVLFVDDRKANIAGAEAMGVPALLFQGAVPLEQQLLARGLRF